jgi:hypothetical protein
LPELRARERGRRAFLLSLRSCARVAAAREERKVVTCLFCDLVGFTARAERMDPEDVRRLLRPWYAWLKAGKKLLAEGQGAEASAHLQRSLVLYRPLAATRYIRKAEELLAGGGLEIPA